MSKSLTLYLHLTELTPAFSIGFYTTTSTHVAGKGIWLLLYMSNMTFLSSRINDDKWCDVNYTTYKLVLDFKIYFLVCPKGYFGDTCNMPCRFPSYGADCQSECGCRPLDCNHVTGCDGKSCMILCTMNVHLRNIFLFLKLFLYNYGRLDMLNPKVQ